MPLSLRATFKTRPSWTRSIVTVAGVTSALVAPAGDVDAADAGDAPVGEGMAHHQVQAVGLWLGTVRSRETIEETED